MLSAGLPWYPDSSSSPICAGGPSCCRPGGAGAVLLGTGAFQLYDGTAQHKLLGLHQIRYNVPLLPYDVLWNASAALMILAGAALLYRTRHAAAAVART